MQAFLGGYTLTGRSSGQIFTITIATEPTTPFYRQPTFYANLPRSYHATTEPTTPPSVDIEYIIQTLFV